MFLYFFFVVFHHVLFCLLLLRQKQPPPFDYVAFRMLLLLMLRLQPCAMCACLFRYEMEFIVFRCCCSLVVPSRIQLDCMRVSCFYQRFTANKHRGRRGEGKTTRQTKNRHVFSQMILHVISTASTNSDYFLIEWKVHSLSTLSPRPKRDEKNVHTLRISVKIQVSL